MLDYLFKPIDYEEKFRKLSSYSRKEIIERAQKEDARFKIAFAVGWLCIILGMPLWFFRVTQLTAAYCIILGVITVGVIKLSRQLYMLTLWLAWDRQTDQEAELRKIAGRGSVNAPIAINNRRLEKKAPTTVASGGAPCGRRKKTVD